jgi:hypothetical protein
MYIYIYPPKLLENDIYETVGDTLKPFFDFSKHSRPMNRNWKDIFEQIINLQGNHNPEFDKSF